MPVMATLLGPDGHPIPEIQGVVTGYIQPVDGGQVIRRAMNKGGLFSMTGSALRYPQFTAPPSFKQGTEGRRADGTIVEHTGELEHPDSVFVTPQTLENARNACSNVLANPRIKLTGTALDVALLSLARGILKLEGKILGDSTDEAAARMSAIAVIKIAGALPDTELSCDMLNMAFGYLHLENGGPR